MKRWIFSTLFVIIATPAWTLYNGNPGEPWIIEKGILIKNEAASFKLGYAGSLAFDRKLKSAGKAHGPIDRYRYVLNQGVAAFNIARLVELTGMLGSMDAKFKQHLRGDQRIREYCTHSHLSWGAGLSSVIYRNRKTLVGLEGVYQSARLPVKWNSLDGEKFSSNATVHYRDWQASLGVTHYIELLAPYLALTYSGVSGKVTQVPASMQLGTSQFFLRSRHHVGLSLGCTITTGNFFDATLEAHVVDQLAYNAAINFKF